MSSNGYLSDMPLDRGYNSDTQKPIASGIKTAPAGGGKIPAPVGDGLSTGWAKTTTRGKMNKGC